MRLLSYSYGLAYVSGLEEDLQLHRAVFENNLPLVRRLCVGYVKGVLYTELNEIDLNGSSALMLAQQLKRNDALRVLCDHYCSSKYRPYPYCKAALLAHTLDPSPYELAILEKDREVLKLYVQSNQKLKQHYLDNSRDEIFSLLERLPDFQIDMSFKCDSTIIPFLKSFTPHDKFLIYKSGSNIRLDFSQKTLRSQVPQSGRNHSPAVTSPKAGEKASFLFKGRGATNEGELLYVEHQNGFMLNVLTDMYQNNLDS